MRFGPREAIIYMILALPTLCTALHLHPMTASLLTAVTLLAAWIRNLYVLGTDHRNELVLETMPASHFAEKARWAMDRAGIKYTEEVDGGFFGIIFTGRFIPTLRVKKGPLVSRISNSSDILRYVWSIHVGTSREKDVQFLKPTAEALEYEKKLDEQGRSYQVFVYNCLRNDYNNLRHVWGCFNPAVPLSQRMLLFVLTPLLCKMSMIIFPESLMKAAVENIEAVLADAENRLAGGSKFLLGDELTYIDLTFASSCAAFWVFPPDYSRKIYKAIPYDSLSDSNRQWIEKFRTNYPNVRSFTERLYKEYRSIE